MMEFFLSGSLPLIHFVICDVMSDMANKLLSLSLLHVTSAKWLVNVWLQRRLRLHSRLL